MKTKILPILTTAFTLLCAACSDDSTSNAITGNDDDHGSVIAGNEQRQPHGGVLAGRASSTTRGPLA